MNTHFIHIIKYHTHSLMDSLAPCWYTSLNSIVPDRHDAEGHLMRARKLTRGLQVDRWSRFGPTGKLTDSDYKTKKADTRSTVEGKETLTWTHGRRKARPYDRSMHNLICVSPTSQFTPNNYHDMIWLINTCRYDTLRYMVYTVTADWPIYSFLFNFTPAVERLIRERSGQEETWN